MRPNEETSWVVQYDNATIPKKRKAAILNLKKIYIEFSHGLRYLVVETKNMK